MKKMMNKQDVSPAITNACRPVNTGINYIASAMSLIFSNFIVVCFLSLIFVDSRRSGNRGDNVSFS